jgi:hypothetical protein
MKHDLHAFPNKILNMFESVIIIVFQIVFTWKCIKIYFFIFLNYFWY